MKTIVYRLRAAFSLVETTIALGIVSAGALSVIGLLGSSIHGSREAQKDTVLATIASNVVADLRAAPFDALQRSSLEGVGSAGSYPTLTDSPTDTVLFFNAQGEKVPTGAADAFYECLVKKTPDAACKGVSGGVHNFARVELQFSWPVSSNSEASKRPEQFRFYASIARF